MRTMTAHLATIHRTAHRTLPVLLIHALLLFHTPAMAATFQWTDASGATHYTDNPDKIPDRYLKNAIRRADEPGPVTPEAAQKVIPAQTVAPSAAPPPAAEDQQKFCGKTGSAWKGQFTSIRAEIKQLESSLPGLRKELQIKHTKLLRSLEDGRPKTKEELEKLEKQQKGKGNHAPIGIYGNPVKNRQEYLATYNRTKETEKKIKDLKQQLTTLETEAGKCEVPLSLRN